MIWYGCRGCGWISQANVAGHMHSQGHCQFCDFSPVSEFRGTQEERDAMLANGLTRELPETRFSTV
jgi:hypothetical protein